MKNNHILEIENLYKKYIDKNGNERTILNNINLKVSKGDFVTVVGPTGCGKSTLLRQILGSEKPTTGTIKVNGKEVIEPNRSRGVVFQHYSLYPNLTVRQNVMFGLELEYFTLFSKFIRPFHYISKKKEFYEKADDYLKRVNLLEHADKFPYELSGGMKQRAAIAQAMVMKPEILLMDEPHGALDVGTREEMQIFVLEQWKQANQTIVFVTHDLEEAIYLGSRVLVLSQFYSSEGKPGIGSKIVTDLSINWPIPRSTKIKGSEKFTKMMERIRHDGLDPTYLQNIEDFNLKHNDAL